MAYTKQTWADGDVITADKLNHLEDGVGTTVGPAGPQGPKGATGATGAKGDKGDKGDPGITKQAAEANLATGADLATTVSKVNAILAKLRSAGVISAS